MTTSAETDVTRLKKMKAMPSPIAVRKGRHCPGCGEWKKSRFRRWNERNGRDKGSSNYCASCDRKDYRTGHANAVLMQLGRAYLVAVKSFTSLAHDPDYHLADAARSTESSAPSVEERLAYAFGHAVSLYSTDAHAADSGDVAREELQDLGVPPESQAAETFWRLAEHVAGNYEYTGEAETFLRQVRADKR